MKKLLALLLLLPSWLWAQPIPGLIDAGTIGNNVTYTGTHRVGPGAGTNAAVNPTQLVISGGIISVIPGTTETNNAFKGTQQRVAPDTAAQTNGYMPAINAWDYGLGTNGNVDYTANIQLAINASTNLGRRVIIPAGNWLISGTLTLWRGVELMGESPPLNNGVGTILNPGAGNNTMIFIPTGTAGTYIHNISFVDGSAHNLATAISTSTNANPTGTSDIKIENCSFYGLAVANYFNYSWDIQLINNSYSTTITEVWGTNNVNALDIWGGHFFGVRGVRCDGFACFNWNVHAVFEVCSNAIYFANDCEQMNVDHCYSENNTNFVIANGTYALNVDHNEIDLTSGTNIVLVGCKVPYIGHNRFSSSGSPSWDIDITTFGRQIDVNSFNGAPSWHDASITGLAYDGTNATFIGGNFYWNSNTISSATNSYVMVPGVQMFSTITPMSFTSVTGGLLGYYITSSSEIYNASATNITITFGPSMQGPGGLKQFNLGSAQDATISVSVGVRTNWNYSVSF